MRFLTKLNFKSIQDRLAIKHLLEREVLPGQANLADVQSLLNRQNRTYHHVRDISFHSDIHIKHLISQHYNNFIEWRTSAPSAKKWFGLPIGDFDWLIRFHFASDRLVEIIVTLDEINPL